ncbi:MAG: transcriptional repressor [Propionibacteriales bacterium]|nr:transcriptional repressor [Propionibacteriales bacterium]
MKLSQQRPDARTLLRDAGLRVTAQRVAVLAALQDHPHATVDTVALHARRSLGAVSTQAVYDVLRVCADRGLVRRIEPAGSPALFETRTDHDRDNHHHLVCRSCGVVNDVDCATGAAPCLTPSDSRGFTVDEAEVVYWGYCPACQSAIEPSPPAEETS